jgi:hypothetical protein
MTKLSPESQRVITPPEARGPEATRVLVGGLSSVPVFVVTLFLGLYLFAGLSFLASAGIAIGLGVTESAVWAFVYKTVREGESSIVNRSDVSG